MVIHCLVKLGNKLDGHTLFGYVRKLIRWSYIVWHKLGN